MYACHSLHVCANKDVLFCAVEGIYKCKMRGCGCYYHPACLQQLRPHLKFKVAPALDSKLGASRLAKRSASVPLERPSQSGKMSSTPALTAAEDNIASASTVAATAQLTHTRQGGVCTARGCQSTHVSPARQASCPHSAAAADDSDFSDADDLRGRITCPAHFCHACHLSGDSLKLLQCWLCARAYHSS